MHFAVLNNAVCGIVIAIVLMSTSVFAQQDAGTQEPQVKLNVFLEPSENVLVGQQLELIVEVSTTTWFTGGTRIDSFEVDGLVRLQREPFAVNSNRRIDDQTWSVQRWLVNLYPQFKGEYTIPSFKVSTSVANNANSLEAAEQSQSFASKSQPLIFTAMAPAIADSKLLANSDYVTLITPKFTIKQEIDGKLSELSIGDAVTRTITMQSENLAAMMLPELTFPAPKGLAVYKRPAQLKDNTDRGRNVGSRIESVTYIVETQGSYSLPAIELGSIHASTLEFESHKVDGFELWSSGYEDTKPIGVDKLELGATESGTNTSPIIWLYALLAFTAIPLLYFWLHSKMGGMPNRLSYLEGEYKQACSARNYELASTLLYQWYDNRCSGSKGVSLPIRSFLSEGSDDARDCFDSLMLNAHGEQGSSLAKGPVKVERYDLLINQIEQLFGVDKCDNRASQFSLN